MCKVSKTHPDIHINVCFSRLNVEKLVNKLSTNFPYFVKTTRGRHGLVSKSMEEDNSYGENISSDSQEILRIL